MVKQLLQQTSMEMGKRGRGRREGKEGEREGGRGEGGREGGRGREGRERRGAEQVMLGYVKPPHVPSHLHVRMCKITTCMCCYSVKVHGMHALVEYTLGINWIIGALLNFGGGTHYLNL